MWFKRLGTKNRGELVQQRYTELTGESVLILRKLQELKSLNFVELSALSGVDDQRLKLIVNELQALDLVKIDNPQDLNEAIVTAREQAFATSASGTSVKVATRTAT